MNLTAIAQPDPTTKPRRRWRWYHGLLLLFLLIVLAFAAWRLALESAYRSEIARLRAQGLPTTFAELNNYYAAVPDPQNAAFHYLEAARQFNPPTDYTHLPHEFGIQWPEPWEPLTPQTLNAMRQLIDDNTTLLHHVQLAAPLTQARYPLLLDPTVTRVESLPSDLKDVAILLRYKAAVAASASDSAQASDSIINLIRFAASHDTYP